MPEAAQPVFSQFCNVFSEHMPPEDWRDRDACDGGALLLALWQQVQRPVGDERRLLQMNEAVSSLGRSLQAV